MSHFYLVSVYRVHKLQVLTLQSHSKPLIPPFDECVNKVVSSAKTYAISTYIISGFLNGFSSIYIVLAFSVNFIVYLCVCVAIFFSVFLSLACCVCFFHPALYLFFSICSLFWGFRGRVVWCACAHCVFLFSFVPSAYFVQLRLIQFLRVSFLVLLLCAHSYVNIDLHLTMAFSLSLSLSQNNYAKGKDKNN